MSPFPLLLLFFVVSFWLGRLYLRVKRFDQQHAENERLMDRERQHSQAAGDLSDCPRPLDRDGRPTSGGWYLHPEAAAKRKTRLETFEEEQLHQQVESLMKQVIKETDDP